MIDATEARKGITIELDGQLYNILDYQHIKVGRGSAQVKLRLRDIRAGHTIERTFQAGDRFKRVRLDQRAAQYLYQDGDLYYFMDTETYEQPALSADALGDKINYLKEGSVLSLSMYEGHPVEIELPVTVDLKIAETVPGIRGNTATGATKRAKLETGLTVQVPLFIEEGDVIRVDTRTGEYLTRV